MCDCCNLRKTFFLSSYVKDHQSKTVTMEYYNFFFSFLLRRLENLFLDYSFEMKIRMESCTVSVGVLCSLYVHAEDSYFVSGFAKSISCNLMHI